MELVSEYKTVDGVGDSKVDRTKVVFKTTRSKNSNLVKTFLAKSKSFVLDSRLGFFISKARQAFIELRQVFVQVLIFYYVNQNCHICIEIDVSDNTIGGILS